MNSEGNLGYGLFNVQIANYYGMIVHEYPAFPGSSINSMKVIKW